MPKRIQIKRTKGWKMPPNTVKVDRTTEWGNPFKVGEDFPTAQECVAEYRRMVTEYASRLFNLGKLRGRDLACWCPLDAEHCHADVLLELANA